jgi:serine/threonine-protein kinase
MADATPGRIIGRYALFDVLAAGGMATVHVGRLLGPVGFARTVAIKRLHPQYARDPEFVSMFLDEARMCARIRHPNVVPTLDVVATSGELFLVMEYVQGEALAHLVRTAAKAGKRVPWKVAVSIVAGALNGLHAAHESKDERGIPLGLVHRDVSPQNILVGVDGMARVLDFGIAKATGRMHTTREGAVKGKLGYMAPEQMAAEGFTRQADVYAAAVVLWETLTGQRLFDGDSEAIVLAKVLTGEVAPPSKYAPDVPPELDAAVMKGLTRKVTARFASGKEFANAIEKIGSAPLGEVGEWVESTAGSTLEERAKLLAEVETGSGALTPMTVPPESQPGSGRPTLEGTPPTESSEPGKQVAQSGSIRPTARSESDGNLPDAVPPKKRPPLWIVAGAGAVALLLIAVVWATSGPSASSQGMASSSVAPSAFAPRPSATPVLTAEPAPSATVEASAVVSAAPSASASATATVSTPKLWGTVPRVGPTSTGSSPFNLGGRN